MGGALVTRLVRMPISMLHWKMVSLMLKGAISYARLWCIWSAGAALLIDMKDGSRHRSLRGPNQLRSTFPVRACRCVPLW